MTTNLTPRDWEALSAYLDGQLAPKEQQLLEARMRSRADLRAAMEELRRTRAVLRAHLEVRAPRNFTLTPEMAGVRPRSRPTVAFFPALRLTSAISSLLFVLVALSELLIGGRLALPMAAGEPQREAMSEAVPQEPALEPSAAPAMAVEAPAAEEVEATPQPVAKAVEAPTPSLGLELAQPIVIETETVELPPFAGGMGGGDGADETQLDEEALSQMAPIATATPLPTLTFTPQPSPSPTVMEQPTAPAPVRARFARFPEWTVLRWVEITLAIVGLSTGLLAIILHRRGRS